MSYLLDPGTPGVTPGTGLYVSTDQHLPVDELRTSRGVATNSIVPVCLPIKDLMSEKEGFSLFISLSTWARQFKKVFGLRMVFNSFYPKSNFIYQLYYTKVAQIKKIFEIFLLKLLKLE